MLTFVGSLILALILVYFLLFSGVGITKALIQYDARAVAETIASTISALASFNGTSNFIFALPITNCTLNITQSSVRIKFLGTTLQVEGREIKTEKSEHEMPIVNPENVKILPNNFECDSSQQLFLFITKDSNVVSFSVGGL